MFETIIGLEVHVQLNTKTKLFCRCATSFGEAPNTNVCPVCLALPGALPVLNKSAVKKAVSLGKAIDATINHTSYFDRKNYFYPDLPTGYQISQFHTPIVGNGKLSVECDGKSRVINITRAHLETDAGKNIHDVDLSRVDLNRAGTPLLEIVSEPELRSGEEAISYLKKLHTIVRYLNISDANMQEGSFRCDANVSIRPKGDTKLYTRVEIKNLNSFKFIGKAIAYEVQRQTEAWEDGIYDKEVYQETRLYDVAKDETRSMRGKENSMDYRYFPDPDLLPCVLSDSLYNEAIKIPELPDEKIDRFVNELKLKKYDAKVLSSSIELASFFEDMIKFGASAKNSVSLLTVELLGRLKGIPINKSPIDSKKLSDVVKAVDDSTISLNGAKDVLDFLMVNTATELSEAISKLGIAQVSDDGAILKLVAQVLASNEQKVQEYRDGKEKLFGFFVGQVMKESKGSANPSKVNEILKSELK
jgi:aspartyl-tRNA(Asn)/glutamyl-tRNA(Gln) amidotransferase subunit B